MMFLGYQNGVMQGNMERLEKKILSEQGQNAGYMKLMFMKMKNMEKTIFALVEHTKLLTQIIATIPGVEMPVLEEQVQEQEQKTINIVDTSEVDNYVPPPPVLQMIQEPYDEKRHNYYDVTYEEYQNTRSMFYAYKVTDSIRIIVKIHGNKCKCVCKKKVTNAYRRTDEVDATEEDLNSGMQIPKIILVDGYRKNAYTFISPNKKITLRNLMEIITRYKIATINDMIANRDKLPQEVANSLESSYSECGIGEVPYYKTGRSPYPLSLVPLNPPKTKNEDEDEL